MNIFDFLSEEQQTELLDLINKGYSTYELAIKFHVTQSRIARHLRRAGIKTNPRYAPTKRKKIRYCVGCNALLDKSFNAYCDACIKLGKDRRRNDNNLELAKSDKIRKRILINRRTHKCEICQNTEWLNNPITLELHHVDGNSDNNIEENLQLLCPNCHSMTSTYKARNMKNGSVRSNYRKKYYRADGDKVKT